MGLRGPKKGVKYAKTLAKEEARALLRELVLRDLEPLVDAQKANAKGLKYLVARNKKTGKFEKLTASDARLDPNFESDSEVIEVWESQPSVQAFTDLMNRALDKPIEQVQMEHSGSVDFVQRLAAARKRASGK